jgi:hypothetical protein
MMNAEVFASPALPLLLGLEARGCHLNVIRDRLIVEPASLLTPDELAAVYAHAEALAALLRVCDDQVQARRAVFARQLAGVSEGVLPALLFRDGVPYVAGVCFACGDGLERARFGRCWRCALGWRLAAGVPIHVDVATARDVARVLG